MPWGVTYGHNPVYDGPAESGKYHDLANLKPWSHYDRHGGNLANRSLWDANCLRIVEGGAPLTPERLAEMFKQGLYASTVFISPPAPGKPWSAELLKTIDVAPNVVAVSPGPRKRLATLLLCRPRKSIMLRRMSNTSGKLPASR